MEWKNEKSIGKWKISHSSREANLVLLLIQESQIKTKTVISWSL